MINLRSRQEELVENFDSILWVGDLVSDGARVFVNLMVVSSLIALVSEEVDFIVLLLNVLEAERFVPPLWEDVKRYLASD